MRAQFVLSALTFAAAVTAQSSSSFITTPIDITGTNISPPTATPTSIETQSPRPSLSASSESQAPTETFPSISDGPTSEAPTETMPTIVPSVTQPTTNSLSSLIGSASSALSSLASAASTIASASPSASQNAGVPLQIGVAGWTVGVVLAGVAAGAAML